jgi:hypothetical protein
MALYDVPTDGCNLEIMGYSFFAEEVSPTEAFRRRELNFNSIVGGTKKVTKGEYVGLEFSVTTHVKIDPKKPNMHNKIFNEMMSKPVKVVSPDLGGSFNASVIIKPERESPRYLKLKITIKEIPGRESQIPGEQFTVPSPRKITVTKKKTSKKSDKTSKNSKSSSKKKSISKKSKSKSKK